MLLLLGFVGYLVWPFFTPSQTGSSGQGLVTEGYPLSVSAVGDDARTRTLLVTGEGGEEVDLSQLQPGQRLVVSGSGFDPDSGIYVAICALPPTVDVKPGPCLGGVPESEATAPGEQGQVDWAASNWINDDWAWKLFGARAFDDPATGAFTAYVLVPEASDEFVDCRASACGLYTRNDHTDVANRVQDLYLPVSFSE